MTESEKIALEVYKQSRRKHKGIVPEELIVTRDATLQALAEEKKKEKLMEQKRIRYEKYEKAYLKAMRSLEVG